MSRLDWIDPSATGHLPLASEPGADSLQSCRRCDLWRNATQAVGGEGPRDAVMMLVGEQPGDVEDQQGRPFVGPAGQLLDQLLQRAGIDRSEVWLTNAVKHFKWEPRGKRRLHRTPTAAEVGACLPWLEAEIELIKPRVLVCLGATATHALLGRGVSVTRDRGRRIESPLAPHVTATVHPSSILRAPDEDARRRALDAFVTDFEGVSRALATD
jgi:uracil-DNA glycosylase